jgi:hypothetical protein
VAEPAYPSIKKCFAFFLLNVCEKSKSKNMFATKYEQSSTQKYVAICCSQEVKKILFLTP